MNKVKKKNLYLKAARLVCEKQKDSSFHPYSCHLLRDLRINSDKYKEIYEPSYYEISKYRLNPDLDGYFGHTEKDENILTRSLALLFMHEMEKDGLL
jgi:hypothetical protein